MVFLLIRIFPYLLPLVYFSLIKLMFVYFNWWWIFGLVFLVLLFFNFILLRYKNFNQKNLIWYFLFAIIYGGVGWLYVLILEVGLFINLFLIAWSFIYWLYLEAVFHEFYETNKQYVLNLSNIVLYGNVLILFFLTSVLVNFYIFLNLAWWWLTIIIFFVCIFIIYLAYLKQNLSDNILMYSIVGSWLIIQSFLALLFLPVSLYLVASIVSLVYYAFVLLTLLNLKKQLTKNNAIKILGFTGLILLFLVFTAKWI